MIKAIAIYFGLFVFWGYLHIYFFASKDESIYTRLASLLIGHPPKPGDGAFQIPLGWLLMIVVTIVLTYVSGSFILKTME